MESDFDRIIDRVISEWEKGGRQPDQLAELLAGLADATCGEEISSDEKTRGVLNATSKKMLALCTEIRTSIK